ncbi:iron-sulfur cluster assembly factor IBA57, mitochondrial isoform X1 [Ascaphus truei]|uniref:iron-sulfur cluster assembly factor IBA57, mitochondrial isoform X1 n=1 Tax=Ascaphus truei TaxID=8439 RepID=UPI003F590D2E
MWACPSIRSGRAALVTAARMLTFAAAALRRPLAPPLLRCSRRLSGVCYPLAERRGLLRLRGPDAVTFLQGLTTNDAERLRGGACGALHAHLLNVQGRSLADVILYSLSTGQSEPPDILLECDVSSVAPIQKHLTVYKIRRKVDIAPCPELSVWAVIPGQETPDPSAEAIIKLPDPAVLCTPDPRAAVMGWRLVAGTGGNPGALMPETRMGNVEDYCKHRYETGVPEGAKDIPPGVALPLESNLVYMNGISFSKGCYIGQELTARTHHTGVIRKRLLPVRLSSPLPAEAEGAEICTQSGKSAGKYRAGVEDYGLALLRLAHINEPLHIKIPGEASISVKASVPEWWPKPSEN